MTVAAHAGGVAIYGAFVATVALVFGGGSLIWNVINSRSERKARRSPDVHAVVSISAAGANSTLDFANAGPGLARYVEFLLVENGLAIHGGVGKPYLGLDQEATVNLPFASTVSRSTFIWAYMDTGHNVHARSNNGDLYLYTHPTRVDLGQIFQRFYPNVTIPEHVPFGILGEL